MATRYLESDSNKPLFHFFCINTSLNDYHFCWAINEGLNVALSRIEDFSFDESVQTFSVFQDKNTNPSLVYSLLSIKSENGLLMKDLSGFDFLFCVEGQVSEDEIDQIQRKVSEIKNVLLITNLENKKLKATTISDLSYVMEMIG